MSNLVRVNDYTDESVEIKNPIRLSKENLQDLTVNIAGNIFINTGHRLACPTCGKVSGMCAEEDPDKQVFFFLKFGCEHYNDDKKESPIKEE